MTPRSLRISPSWTSFTLSQSSPANSVHSEVEESLPQATTSNLKAPSWRSLSRPSSRSRVTPESSSKGDRHTQKADPANDVPISTKAPVSCSAILAGRAKPQTVWSTDDSYLPRAKPPPPLKRTKHQRNRSEHNFQPPLDPTTPSQPSTSRSKSSRQSSQSHSTVPPSPPSSLDTPVLDISRENRDGPIAQHTLTRSSTRLSGASEASDDRVSRDISFAPIRAGSSWSWEPPTSWAGPSTADEGDGSKPVGGWPFARKKSAESSPQGSSTQAPTGLNPARSLNELRPIHPADVGEPEKHVFGTRSGPLSSGAAVKIQCYENHGWQEKPVADVIPMLRELKIK